MARRTLLHAGTVTTALQAAPSSSYSGYVARFVHERYRRYVGSPAGACKNGGRYNSKGTNAVYTSILRPTALAEFTQNYDDTDPIPAASMVTLGVSLRHVVDVTGVATIAALGTTIAELREERLPVYHSSQVRLEMSPMGSDSTACSSGALTNRPGKIWCSCQTTTFLW